ncbi:MAG: hypothetical protein IJO19_02490 [Clostridia bacterium]|nr:hypothetical protein [Clostridia bacterium]
MKIYDNGIIREATAEEIARLQPTIQEQIEMLKQQLKDTDYKAIKFAEGFISDEDYAETKALRQAWRDEINRLESEGDQ